MRLAAQLRALAKVESAHRIRERRVIDDRLSKLAYGEVPRDVYTLLEVRGFIGWDGRGGGYILLDTGAELLRAEGVDVQ